MLQIDTLNIYGKLQKVHQHIAAKNNTLFVSFYDSASALEALACGKVPIELWSVSKRGEKSPYKNLKLCLVSNDELSLYKNLKTILYKKNFVIQKQILKRFSKLKKNNSINSLSKIILKYLKH